MMKIMLVTKNVGCIFSLAVADALKEMGHDVLRSVRKSAKRTNICIDQPVPARTKVQQFTQFNRMELSHVPFTTSKQQALAWLMEDAVVVCRKLTLGHSGEGIVLADNEEDMVDCSLYTKYTKKKAEFRVHVFDGKAIFIQQKKQKSDAEDVNYQIRNHKYGWVFCHNDLEIPDKEGLCALAVGAVKSLGYAFGAVDVIYNQKKDQYYLLEVNSRPGIEGETAIQYATHFIDKATAPEQKEDKTATLNTAYFQYCATYGVSIKREMLYKDFCNLFSWTVDHHNKVLYGSMVDGIMVDLTESAGHIQSIYGVVI